jgi:hypothetical protein
VVPQQFHPLDPVTPSVCRPGWAKKARSLSAAVSTAAGTFAGVNEPRRPRISVLFRSDWTDPPTVEQAIRYVLDARGRRREGLNLKPFYAELLGFRWSDQQAFVAGLEIAGPQAVSDFQRATIRWTSGNPFRGRIEPPE